MEALRAVPADITRHGCSWCASIRINRKLDRFELLRSRKDGQLFCSTECRDIYRETMKSD